MVAQHYTPREASTPTPLDGCDGCLRHTGAVTSVRYPEIDLLVAAYWCRPCERVWQTSWSIRILGGDS